MTKSRFLNVVIFGAAGGFGGLFQRALSDAGADVSAFDILPDSGCRHGDAERPSAVVAEAVKGAELVLLCLPDSVADRSLSKLLALATRECLFVEVRSVMRDRRSVAADTEMTILSLNPLFAPDLGFDQRSVVVSCSTSGSKEQQFVALLEAWGAQIVKLEADEHNQLSAATQALVHMAVLGVALTVSRLHANTVEGASPPPSAVMSMLAARMLVGESATYWSIQAENPFAARARHVLLQSLVDMYSAIDSRSLERFNELWHEAATGLGRDLRKSARDCAELFAKMKQQE